MTKILAVVLACCLVAVSSLAGETKVTVSNVHICCKACVDGIEKALKDMKGSKHVIDKDGGTVAILAEDAASAQAAVDALAGAGYHGKSDNKDIAIKDNSGAADGKVKTLEISNIHNCCGKCTSAIDKAIKAVPGVKNTTAKAKLTSFNVTGDFEAKAVVKALNDAGFHATVK